MSICMSTIRVRIMCGQCDSDGCTATATVSSPLSQLPARSLIHMRTPTQECTIVELAEVHGDLIRTLHLLIAADSAPQKLPSVNTPLFQA